MIHADANKQLRDKISEFERELASLRKAAYVSQSKLGKKIGLSRQFLSEIELGKAPMFWAIYVAAVKFFLVNRNKVIDTVINEHAAFVEQYMKSEEGANNADNED